MHDTIPALFLSQLKMGRDRPALRSKRGSGWATTTWDEWNRKSRAIAARLIELGVQPGDRVAILSNTREEWVIADMAVLFTGAITVPVYPTMTPAETTYLLENSGAKIIFVENPEQFEKLSTQAAALLTKELEHVIVFDCQAMRDVPRPDRPVALTCSEVAEMVDIDSSQLAQVVTRGETILEDPEQAALLDARIEAIRSEDLASIVYTAGAAGQPKGVMLTHGNFCFEVRTARETLGIGDRDEQLLFLPLAHILGKILYIIHLEIGGTISFAENMLHAIDNAADVNPTFFGSVPRVFEKFYQVAERSAEREGPVRQKLYRWALDVGHRMALARRSKVTPPLSLVVQHRYADKMVLRPLRSRFGKRIRFAISGGAPLTRSLGEWFEAIGIPILEGYGLTETTGACNVNRPDNYKFGTVGPPLNGVENKIAPDGEILIRGASVMKGYWKDPKATEEMIDEEGWLHSGDIGRIDADGMLIITDRKKDLIITSGGKNIAPQHIEKMLRASPWISRAAVIGDGRKYLTALITLDERSILRWASEHGLPQDLEKLAREPELQAMIKLDVDAVNRRLARYETIKDFRIVPRDFSISHGELTPTGRLKRDVIAKHFADLIDEMYE